MHRYSGAISSYSGLLTESRIPLKPVRGGMRIVALSISFHEQTKNESVVFQYCRFSLFLKNPVFQIIYTLRTLAVRSINHLSKPGGPNHNHLLSLY